MQIRPWPWSWSHQHGRPETLTQNRWVSVGSQHLFTLESLPIAARDVFFHPSQRPASNCSNSTENSSKELPHHRESDADAKGNNKLDPLGRLVQVVLTLDIVLLAWFSIGFGASLLIRVARSRRLSMTLALVAILDAFYALALWVYILGKLKDSDEIRLSFVEGHNPDLEGLMNRDVEDHVEFVVR